MTSESQKEPQESQKEPSGSKAAEPSTPPKTYQQEDVDKLVAGVQSGLDKEIAGLKKSAAANAKATANLKTQLEAEKGRADELQKAKEQAEFDAIPRDNPDALSLYTARQAHREDVRAHEANVAEFDAMKAEWQEAVTAAKAYKTLQAATEIVSRDEFKGVKADDLVELTDGSPDKMEALAKALKLTIGGTPPSTGPEIPPDTGGGQGAAGQLTTEQADKMSMEEYVAHPQNVERMNERV